MSIAKVRFAPLSGNLLASATVLTSDNATMRGHDQSNLTLTADPARPALYRGRFEVAAGVNDKIDVTDGIGRTATLAAGTYYGQELAVEMARALNAMGGTTYTVAAHPTTGVWTITSTGATTLLTSSGGNTATSAIRFLLGQPAVDTSSGTSHALPLAARHGAVVGQYGGDITQWDLGSAQAATCAVVMFPELGPAGRVWWHAGASASAYTSVQPCSARPQPVMCTFFGSVSYRYWTMHLFDPRRSDLSYVGAGLAYLGTYLEAGQNWEPEALSITLPRAGSTELSQAGSPVPTERETGARIRLSFGGGAGTSETDTAELLDTLQPLGRHQLVIVALDATDRLESETFLARVVSPPTATRRPTQSSSGRSVVSIELEEVAG